MPLLFPHRTLQPIQNFMLTRIALFIVVACLTAGIPAAASQPQRAASRSAAVVPVSVPPPDYTIGPDDKLSIVFWKDTEITSEVVVRPDGRISLPLLNDVQAAGLTPDQLRERLLAAASRFIADPAATVVVKEINSRRVFITGSVEKPGSYPLNTPTTVLQLIATAGGLKEFVSGKNIVVVRPGNTRIKFNYRDVVGAKKLGQNIELRPGDTVIVP
jgi:polysaccharide export outer membrane protein